MLNISSTEKALGSILDILIDTNVQLSALKDVIFTEYFRHTGENIKEVLQAFSERFAFHRAELVNKIKTHYSDQYC